jgi:flagellar secretion chaperone FliS
MSLISAYRSAQVLTAPPEQLVVLLLERAVREEDEAIAAMERGARQAWIAHLNHCRAIFVELQIALDHTVAPGLTATLHSLYAGALRKITEASRTGNIEVTLQLRDATAVLHEAWIQVLHAPPESAEREVA